MSLSTIKKLLLAASLIGLVILSQSFSGTSGGGKGGSNLKVLPKNISEEELISLMRVYAKSLGVKCKACHTPMASDSTKLDFASDAKHEKIIARKMMAMVNAINKKYIGKMDDDFEDITCVTCHMGHVHPLVSVDSLKKQP